MLKMAFQLGRSEGRTRSLRLMVSEEFAQARTTLEAVFSITQLCGGP
jgi:hypothetical protein